MNRNKKRISRITVRTLIIHLFSLAIILSVTALYVHYVIKNSKVLAVLYTLSLVIIIIALLLDSKLVKADRVQLIEVNKKRYIPVCVKAEFVDGERIKEDTWYKLIEIGRAHV